MNGLIATGATVVGVVVVSCLGGTTGESSGTQARLSPGTQVCARLQTAVRLAAGLKPGLQCSTQRSLAKILPAVQATGRMTPFSGRLKRGQASAGVRRTKNMNLKQTFYVRDQPLIT